MFRRVIVVNAVSNVTPDDGGIGEMVGRRIAQERLADIWGCDPAEVVVDYPASGRCGDPDDTVGQMRQSAAKYFAGRAEQSYQRIANGPFDTPPPAA